MSTRDADDFPGDRTQRINTGAMNNEFIDDAMASESSADAAPTPGAAEGSHRATPAKPHRRRPPAWLLAAAAALVIGLVVGLFFGRGTDSTQAAAPNDSSAPATEAAIPQVVTSLAHIAPVQVLIPSIEVDSPLVNLGLNQDGTLEVPVDFGKAGWFTGGNYPGDPSGPPGLIAGHVDDYTGPAIFYDLKNLVVGDEVHVVRADNSVAVFVVSATAQYPKNEFPAAEVYAPVPDSQIVLVTCTGTFNESTRSYLDNFVVRAVLNMDRSLEESNLRISEGITPPAVNQENV